MANKNNGQQRISRALDELSCNLMGEALDRIARRMVGFELDFPAYGAVKPTFFRRLFGPKLKEVKRLDC